MQEKKAVWMRGDLWAKVDKIRENNKIGAFWRKRAMEVLNSQ
jgi:hypothetical protein